MNNLVLSIFSGIDLLGMAFEEEGYCVVGFIDSIWGRDIRTFHPPAGVFEGIIGGPPCQAHSSAAMNRRRPEKNMIPDFARVVNEASPSWWLMENTRRVPTPDIRGYRTQEMLINNRWFVGENGTGPEQNRIRKIVFGSKDERHIVLDSVCLFESPTKEWCVTASEMAKGRPGHGPYSGRHKRRPLEKQLELMGLPGDFFGKDSPFTLGGKGMLIGNGVPLPMGRAIAKAIKRSEAER